MRVAQSLIFAPSGEPGAADPAIARDSSCTCSTYQTPKDKIRIFGEMNQDEVQAESVLFREQEDILKRVTGSPSERSEGRDRGTLPASLAKLDQCIYWYCNRGNLKHSGAFLPSIVPTMLGGGPSTFTCLGKSACSLDQDDQDTFYTTRTHGRERTKCCYCSTKDWRDRVHISR